VVALMANAVLRVGFVVQIIVLLIPAYAIAMDLISALPRLEIKVTKTAKRLSGIIYIMLLIITRMVLLD